MSRSGFPLATVVVLAVLLLVAARHTAAGAITCGRVVSLLSPCVTYARYGGQISDACCNGVKGLVEAANTTPDRRTACNCLKNTAAGMPDLRPDLVAGIPGKCGVHFPYAISPSTDCSRVS